MTRLGPNAHLYNSVFEGLIGLCHIFLPDKIYAVKEPLPEQVLLSKFVGLLMLCISIIGYGGMSDLKSRAGKYVMYGLCFYHSSASLTNLVYGCGIDGDFNNSARDYSHATIHGLIALSFLILIVRGREKEGNANLLDNANSNKLRFNWMVKNGGNTLMLELQFKDWKSLMITVNEISAIAERLNHHPDLNIYKYKNLTIEIKTHCTDGSASSANTIQEKDFELAREIEQLTFVNLSQKFLDKKTE